MSTRPDQIHVLGATLLRGGEVAFLRLLRDAPTGGAHHNGSLSLELVPPGGQNKVTS
jgi:hypothetical protein